MSIARLMQMGAAAPTGPEGAWDLSYAYYDPPASLAWDLSTASSVNINFSTTSQTTSPIGVFFKPDGSKMYVLSNAVPQSVYEYDLSVSWLVSSATYVQSFAVGTQDTSPTNLFFKPDGTKLYITGRTNDNVYEYDLSTAWDISTASFNQSLSVAAQDTNPYGIWFKPDGLKMYVTGWSGVDLNEYDLSTAWDISTASYLQNFSLSAQDASPRQISFNSDGTTMFMVGITNDRVYEYSLSTAWDISTLSYVTNFSVASQEITPSGLFAPSEGGRFYIVGSSSDKVHQYTIGGFSVAAQETSPKGLFFKPDGTKMYFVGAIGDDVNEYSLSTAWDISTASYVQNFSVAVQESVPNGLSFKPDGTKMYIVGQNGDDVNEYSLSTAWDISTASYVQNFSVAAQDTVPYGLFFKPDGTKMYVTGSDGDAVYEYSLSTDWDVSTASYVQNFSVAAQDTVPQGIFFKPDGLKMYVTGAIGDAVNEYDLSTAWDVSSSSFLQSFSVAAQEGSPSGIFFNPEGTEMYLVGVVTDSIYSYTLGVQE